MIIPFLYMVLIGCLITGGNLQDKPIAKVEKNIDIQIVFPDQESTLSTSPCYEVRVLIINHTDTVASFFEDWNSWGYFNISFQVTALNTTYVVSKKARDWDKNFPSYKTLFPGDTLSVKYSFDYGGCVSSSFNATIPQPRTTRIKIQAVYQLKKEVLDDAKLRGTVKYKQIYKPGTTRRNASFVIVDSLKTAVEINRTFPLVKLESRVYEL